MTTEVLRVLDRAALQEELARAGRILREGGLVAFPTETVYGIAVSAERSDAVERLYEIKGRPREKPMTMMLADTAPLFARCPNVPLAARTLMKRFWPGPLTLVIPDAEGRLCGFRLPASPLARGLVREAGVPLLVPSANKSGEPPATTAAEVLRQLPEGLDLVIDGGPTEGGVASTVVQVTDQGVVVLRDGAIPESRILAPHGATILFVCQGNTDRSPLAAAILKRRLARHLCVRESELESKGYRVWSAGVSAVEGRRASLNARRIAREWDGEALDLETHVAHKLTGERVEAATRIFCMERGQREQILAFFPHRERDVLLLDPEGRDVPDPDGQGLAEYRRLARRLDAVAALLVGGLVQ
jgi:tRNA threonylcarbamoyl adenosine modification protein (Sua5/YciO/YrdC/YwlC family)